MADRPIVTLLTDFGSRDGFVGQLKGAALAVEPALNLIDITHEIPAHDVHAGAFRLQLTHPVFPEGTIHLAVVDPGVGSARRGVVVRTGRHLFVAPDNGILSRVLEHEPAWEAHVLEEPRFQRTAVGSTFHGRDLFAPAAAWLARGTPPNRFGPPAGELVRLPRSTIDLQPGVPCGVRVLWTDRFGNLTLDVTRAELEHRRFEVRAGERVIRELREYYAGGEGHGPFVLFDSADQLEIAMRERRAGDELGLAAGDTVQLTVV